jgi:hypothetical protein
MIESKKPQNKLMPVALSFKGKKFIHSSKNLLGLGLNLLLLIATMRSAQAVPETARRADDFVDSIGVNTHLYYDSSVYHQQYSSLIKPKLQELGVRHIRDGATRNLNGYMDRLKELSTLGIRSTLVCDPRDITPQAAVNLVKELGATSVVEAVQGTNEYNLSGDGNWVNNVRNYQQQLYTLIKNDSVTRNVQVYGPSLSGGEAYDAIGDLSAYVDYGTMNNYFGGRNPGTKGWGSDDYGSLDWNVRTAKKASVSKQIITTETGYHSVVSTNDGHKGIPEDVSGKYTPRLLLEQFNYGIPRTFIYELINVYNDPNSLYKNFGLLRNDGTEKPAFVAVKNLIGLVKDPGTTFTPGSLDYFLGGNTADIHHTLLQKQDGRFYLILWKEVSSFNVDTKQTINVSSQKVSLTLNTAIAKATIYIPNNSPDLTFQQTYPKTLDIDVSDRPVVIELAKS